MKNMPKHYFSNILIISGSLMCTYSNLMVIYQLDDRPKQKVLQVKYLYIKYKQQKENIKMRKNNLKTLNYFNNRDYLI